MSSSSNPVPPPVPPSSFNAGAFACAGKKRMPSRPPAPPAPPAGMTVTENGATAVSDTGLANPLLGLSFNLVRSLDRSSLLNRIEEVLSEAWTSSSVPEVIAAKVTDLFVLLMQTRWSRGGKGERSLALSALRILYPLYPSVVTALLALLPSFGYWKDPLLYLKECHPPTTPLGDPRLSASDAVSKHRRSGIRASAVSSPLPMAPLTSSQLASLTSSVFGLFASTLRADLAELELSKAECRAPSNVSLCAKYAPSEKKEFDRLFAAVQGIASAMFPAASSHKDAKKQYRKACAQLRVFLDVPEVKECARNFKDLDFDHVPSLCLSRKMNAYLNEKSGGGGSDDDAKYEETGNRHPEDADRVLCRKHLIEKTMSKGGVKGKDLFPHELVEKVCGDGPYGKAPKAASKAAALVVNSQWNAIRDGVLAQVSARKELLAKDAAAAAGGGGGGAPAAAKNAAFDLGKVIVMSDVSGSMNGTPMMVSIAMGLLMSEICHPAFRDLVLTFDSNPVFHRLPAEASFTARAKSLQGAPWGGSTNFFGAMQAVASLVRENRLTAEEVPDLMVVSDMQFDEADHGDKWETMYDKIVSLFHDLGMELHGKPMAAPSIIFWNVRAAEGFPCSADQRGVMFLSGYSASLMKFVLSGEMETSDVVVNEETGEVDVVKRTLTPHETLRKMLDDVGLLPVRELCERFKAELGKNGGESGRGFADLLTAEQTLGRKLPGSLEGYDDVESKEEEDEEEDVDSEEYD